MGRRLPGFTRKVIYCAHPIAARFSLPFELPAYYCAPLVYCSLCPCEHMGATTVGAFDGSRQRAPTYNLANTHTLRTGEYSHGDRMEALPVPVVLRLNRGGRKSRRAICNCSRCAAAPQASPLMSCWSIASCTKR